MDTAPFVPGHRPKLFYGFSASAAVQVAAESAGAGRQYVLHNKAGKGQAHYIRKADQLDDEI